MYLAPRTITVAMALVLLLGGFDVSGLEAAGENPIERFLSDSPRSAIPFDEIHRGGPPVDGIPALDHPDTVAVEAMTRLRGDDRMMVVGSEGVVRGYPYRILNWHELVNDRVGSRDVLVTYCPLCGSGVVFDRRVEGKTLSFGVSGLLYQNDVLFFDRRTDSLWSQLEARAVVGPLTEARLSMVPFETLRWEDFKQQYPDGEVISFNTGYDRDYDRDPYARYRQSRRVMFPVEHRDDRLHPKTPVVGLTLDDRSRAYTRSFVQKKGLIADELGDQAYVILSWRGGVRAYRLPKPVSLSVGKEGLKGPDGFWIVREDALMAPDGSSHPRIALIESYWFAWLTFHPDTDLRQ